MAIANNLLQLCTQCSINIPYTAGCRHRRLENSLFTPQNSMANGQWPIPIFYSDVEPL